ncbi:multicopper oxidase family protein [Pseudarthrobacter sp. NIBRBAC000502771]|uniref:multicopper oxidase family protein n=1 Tax=Pseudarthrobacter sp. NIBRBAC000502771 TaxID=2590774 RepID=UPI00143D110A|nr:multicopper oxidase domain-containing protein [Pseudarthrobacter sp. NIBRBAC000502771]
MKLNGKMLAGLSAIALVTALTGAQVSTGANNDGPGRDGNAPVATTIPTTPGVDTDMGELQGDTRIFRLTAVEVTQQIATFPIKTAKVLGWKATGSDDIKASSPGPTLVSYEGEKVQFVVTNDLDQPTSLHPHGTHEPNAADGVAGIDFEPVKPGTTRTYPAYQPGHAGTFAYHTHTKTAEQEPRGLVGLITILPKTTQAKQNPQIDIGMTLQQFNPSWDDGRTVSEGAPAVPKPDERGMFPFSTINGKTGDAAGGPININQGDLVQIRLYNASGMAHSMHLHGMDMTLVDINGHPTPPTTITTQAIEPGEFFTVQFRANNPGNWVFHCSFPGHQANASESGYQGAPVGMLRIFHYSGSAPVPADYFGSPS